MQSVTSEYIYLHGQNVNKKFISQWLDIGYKCLKNKITAFKYMYTLRKSSRTRLVLNSSTFFFSSPLQCN